MTLKKKQGSAGARRKAQGESIQRRDRDRSLPFRVSAFVTPGLGTRHVLEHREGGRPVVAASPYEVHLAQKSDSPNTRLAALRPLTVCEPVPLNCLLLTEAGASGIKAWLGSV